MRHIEKRPQPVHAIAEATWEDFQETSHQCTEQKGYGKHPSTLG